MTTSSIGEWARLFTRLRRCAPVITRALGNRAQLAALEANDAGIALAFMFALGVASAAFLFLTAISLALLVAAIFWDTPYRVTAIGIFTGVELLIAVIAVIWLRSRARHWAPFEETREQLQKDTECIESLFEENERK